MKTRITIENPCTADWAAMSGDERRRRCSQCDKHVHDISMMREREAEALVRGAKGRLCVRYQPDAQGRVTHRRSRLARWGAAALVGLAAVPAFAGARIDGETSGFGGWIAEVVAAIQEQVAPAVMPPPMMGEIAIAYEPRAFENQTDGKLSVDCGGEKAVIEPGETAVLEVAVHDSCTVHGRPDRFSMGSIEAQLTEVDCTPTDAGFTCAPLPERSAKR